MSDKPASVSRVFLTALATSTAGAIVAWLGGFLPAIWIAILAGAAWAWSIASYPIPVPALVLGVLVFPAVILGWRRFERSRAQLHRLAAPSIEEESAPPLLTELETGLMRLLAMADGKLVEFEDAAIRLRTSNLLLSQACESLEDKRLVNASHNLRGTLLALTRYGRDFVVDKGYQLGGLTRY